MASACCALANPRASLWKTALADESVATTVAERIALPSGGGRSPRLGPDYLLYVVTRGDQDRLWSPERLGARTLERTEDPHRRRGRDCLDRRSVAFTSNARAPRADADGCVDARAELAATLDVHGSPDWAPDGRSITVAGASTAHRACSASRWTVRRRHRS
jgi:hypothetical protein